MLIGFIPALLLPIIFIMLLLHFRYDASGNMGFLIQEFFRIGRLSALLALGVVPNLLLFFLAINRENWALGRGIIAATMFYGIAVVMIKML